MILSQVHKYIAVIKSIDPQGLKRDKVKLIFRD
jgi:hypothetical protein